MSATLGNEPTPEAYVAHLVWIFREVRRTLRDDGVCFVNLGDSFNTSASGKNGERSSTLQGTPETRNPTSTRRARQTLRSLPQKNLLLIPARFALAAQADGWFVRQVISWQKLSPMPSSARDRPTTATEEIFVLAKRARYFWDADACRVPDADSNAGRARALKRHGAGAEPPVKIERDEEYAVKSYTRGLHGVGTTTGNYNPAGRNLWSWWDVGEDEEGTMAARLRWLLGPEPEPSARPVRIKSGAIPPGATRRKDKDCPLHATDDSVPVEAPAIEGVRALGCTCSYYKKKPGAIDHYAAFPSIIPERAYRLTTSLKGQCPACGTPWARVVERKGGRGVSWHNHENDAVTGQSKSASAPPIESRTLGWRQGCDCPPAEPLPQICLDPFCGSGTSGVVARALGRRFVGIEPSLEYAAMSRRKIAQAAPLDDWLGAKAAPAQPTLFALEDVP
jgi:DNA modification methylase